MRPNQSCFPDSKKITCSKGRISPITGHGFSPGYWILNSGFCFSAKSLSRTVGIFSAFLRLSPPAPSLSRGAVVKHIAFIRNHYFSLDSGQSSSSPSPRPSPTRGEGEYGMGLFYAGMTEVFIFSGFLRLSPIFSVVKKHRIYNSHAFSRLKDFLSRP